MSWVLSVSVVILYIIISSVQCTVDEFNNIVGKNQKPEEPNWIPATASEISQRNHQISRMKQATYKLQLIFCIDTFSICFNLSYLLSLHMNTTIKHSRTGETHPFILFSMSKRLAYDIHLKMDDTTLKKSCSEYRDNSLFLSRGVNTFGGG